jgi:hypothetical protein
MKMQKIITLLTLLALAGGAGAAETLLKDSAGIIIELKCRYDEPTIDTVTVVILKDNRLYTIGHEGLRGSYPASDYAIRVIRRLQTAAERDAEWLIKSNEDLQRLRRVRCEK